MINYELKSNLSPAGKLLHYLKICNLQSAICNPRREGFTLVEVLLSLVLLTIVLGAVYSSFFTVQSAIERFDGITLKYHEVRNVLDLMRREIDGAIYKSPPSQDSENYHTKFVIEDRDIFGKPTSRLHLTTLSLKGNGLHEISYYVWLKDKNLVLVKKDLPAFLLLTAKSQTEVFPDRGYVLEMIEGIEGFTVETLFNDKWTRTWDTKETGILPETVRFSIEFDDKGRRVKLTEYARPKLDREL